jgi:predicted nucleic-acid-binding Zn-ribbon protein
MFNIWTSIQKRNTNPEKGSRDFKPIKCLKLRNKNYSLSMLNTTCSNHEKKLETKNQKHNNKWSP